MAALDLILKTLMCSTEFIEAEEKNWEAVAKLIPGSTAQQCCKRWKELQKVNFPIQYKHYGSHTQSGGVQQVLSKLLKYDLINDSKSKPKKTFSTCNNSLILPDDTMATNSVGQDEKDDTDKDSLLKQQGHSDLDQNALKHSHPAKSSSSGRESVSGPNMVIHVCDESKNLKQDFNCPRDLLIREMRYFAEYLSVEAQRWEEVDISVHCDIQIFDWLMRYAKKNIGKDNKQPQLEPNNVISILISSDFLKMDSLVSECIEYCHKNMSAIVSTPCNMNCINDKLVTRIADLYNHSELDDIKDRKDKFKSKLYCKKIEDLFDSSKPCARCPMKATTMYRCSACRCILTAESERKLQCVPNRLMIDRQGSITFVHIRDPNWNVNDYILGLREKLKSWKDVYWRLWGAINILYCFRCGRYFQCSELGHCQYHPSNAEYSPTNKDSIIGVYPCCQQNVLRFDTTGQQMGCSYRDHRVSRNIILSTDDKKDTVQDSSKGTNDAETGKETSQEGRQSMSLQDHTATNGDIINCQTVIEDLRAHRSTIEIASNRLTSARNSELDIFSVEEDVMLRRCPSTEGESSSALPDTIDPSERKTEPQPLPPIRRNRSRAAQRMPMRRLRGQQIRDDDQDQGEDEDQPESEDTEPESKVIQSLNKAKQARKPQSASRRDFSTFKSYKWDLMRSSRWNQDAQREEDQKRMNELVMFLTKQRQASPTPDAADKPKPKEYVGGLYSKIEHQFRLSQQASNPKSQPGSTAALTGPRTRKNASKS